MWVWNAVIITGFQRVMNIFSCFQTTSKDYHPFNRLLGMTMKSTAWWCYCAVMVSVWLQSLSAGRLHLNSMTISHLPSSQVNHLLHLRSRNILNPTSNSPPLTPLCLSFFAFFLCLCRIVIATWWRKRHKPSNQAGFLVSGISIFLHICHICN